MVWSIVKLILLGSLEAFFIKKKEGMENIPKENFIVVMNHESYLDPFVIHAIISAKINKKIYFLGMMGRTKRLWKIGFFNWIFRNWAAIVPYDRGKKRALNELTKLLRKNENAGIFPGGRRSLDGNLTKGKTGAIRLALMAKKPILPLGIKGSFEIAPREQIIPKFRKIIEISIGKPMYFDKYYDKNVDKKTLQELTRKIMREIGKLCDKRYEY